MRYVLKPESRPGTESLVAEVMGWGMDGAIMVSEFVSEDEA